MTAPPPAAAAMAEAQLSELAFNRKYTLKDAKLDEEEARLTAKFKRHESSFESKLKKLYKQIRRLEECLDTEEQQYKQKIENLRERRTKLREEINLQLQLRHPTNQDLVEAATDHVCM
jgi:hypothetical protein